jgi:hypothetical protein
MTAGLVPRPDPACEMCGNRYGFLNSSPHYVNPAMYGSTADPFLEWECGVCRYTVKTRTAKQLSEEAAK